MKSNLHKILYYIFSSLFSLVSYLSFKADSMNANLIQILASKIATVAFISLILLYSNISFKTRRISKIVSLAFQIFFFCAEVVLFCHVELANNLDRSEIFVEIIRILYNLTKFCIVFNVEISLSLKKTIFFCFFGCLDLLILMEASSEFNLIVLWFLIEVLLLLINIVFFFFLSKKTPKNAIENLRNALLLDQKQPCFILKSDNDIMQKEVLINSQFKLFFDLNSENIGFLDINDLNKKLEEKIDYYQLNLKNSESKQSNQKNIKINAESVIFERISQITPYLKNNRAFQNKFEIFMKNNEKKMILKGKIFTIEQTNFYIYTVQNSENKYDKKIENLQLLCNANKKLFCSFSHELKTPINGALPCLEMVRESIENEEIIHLLDISLGSLKLLNNAIDNILDNYLFESKQFVLNEIKFNALDLIAEITEVIGPMAQVKKLKFNVVNMHQLKQLMFSTDFQKLKQILLNLLTNAIQFTLSGEIMLFLEITLFSKVKFIVKDTGIGIEPEKLQKLKNKIKFSLDEELNSTGSCLGLYISEKLAVVLGSSDGLSIESEQGRGSTFSFTIDSSILSYEKVYLEDSGRSSWKRCTYVSLRNSFQTGQASKKSKPLSDIITDNQSPMAKNETISYSIESVEKVLNNYDFNELMKNNRKSKNLFSFLKLGSNTPLNFSLRNSEFNDYVEEKSMLPKSSRDKSSNDLQECLCEEILYVDDDAFNLLSMELILKSLKMKCCKAMNGLEALEKLKMINNKCESQFCKKFEIIFLDYQMPIMDGIETAKRIRKMIEEKEIEDRPIIGCTAFVSKDQILNCLEAGMKDVIFKPLNKNILREIIYKYIT